MSLFKFLNTLLLGSVSSHSLNIADGIVFTQMPHLPEYKSFYHSYLEARGIKKYMDNRALTQIEMDALFDSFVFKTPPDRKTDGHRIRQAFSLLNEKSPTGRTFLKQLPAGIEFNTCCADSSATGWVVFNKKTIFLNTQEFLKQTPLELAVLLAHECAHLIEQNQITMFDQEGRSYYSRLNNQSVCFNNDSHAQTRDAFILRKISEAEKLALEHQIYAEIYDIKETIKKMILLPASFFKTILKKGNSNEKKIKKENWLSSSTRFFMAEPSIIPCLRYHFFKSLFSYQYRNRVVPNKLLSKIEQKKVQEDYIQNKAAKKSMSCSIKDALNIPKVNRTFWFLTGSQLALSSTSLIVPNPASFLYVVGFPIIMDAVKYKDTLVRWDNDYNRNALEAILRYQEPSFRDSSLYMNSVLSALIDKYDGFLSYDDLTKQAILKNSSYDTYIDIAKKATQLSYRVFDEVETFCQIKAGFLNKDAQVEDIFEVKKELFQWAEKDMQIHQRKPLDESIRSAILSQFYYKKVPVDAKSLNENTMLHVTRDPQLVLLLLDNGAGLKRKNKKWQTPLQLLSDDLYADREVRLDFARSMRQNNIPAMLSLLVAFKVQSQAKTRVSLQNNCHKKNIKRRLSKERF